MERPFGFSFGYFFASFEIVREKQVKPVKNRADLYKITILKVTYSRLKKHLNFLALSYRRAFIHLQVEISWDFLQIKIITFVMVNLVLACCTCGN